PRQQARARPPQPCAPHRSRPTGPGVHSQVRDRVRPATSALWAAATTVSTGQARSVTPTGRYATSVPSATTRTSAGKTDAPSRAPARAGTQPRLLTREASVRPPASTRPISRPADTLPPTSVSPYRTSRAASCRSPPRSHSTAATANARAAQGSPGTHAISSPTRRPRRTVPGSFIRPPGSRGGTHPAPALGRPTVPHRPFRQVRPELFRFGTKVPCAPGVRGGSQGVAGGGGGGTAMCPRRDRGGGYVRADQGCQRGAGRPQRQCRLRHRESGLDQSDG